MHGHFHIPVHLMQLDYLMLFFSQIAIAAMYYDSALFFQTLQNSSVPGVEGSLIKHFIGQWIQDTDCFIGLHDRKICVLGLCQLMTMPELPGLEDYREQVVTLTLTI